jgi:hypothetical protein
MSLDALYAAINRRLEGEPNISAIVKRAAARLSVTKK